MSTHTKIYHIKTDLEGKYVYANEYFTQKFGFLYADLHSQESLMSIFEGDRYLVINAIKQLLSQKTKIEAIEIRKPIVNGGFVWTHWEFTVEYNKLQIPVGIDCIGFDLTESRHLEIQNQNLLQSLNKSQEISATATYMYDLVTENFTASHQLGSIFGVNTFASNLLIDCLLKIHPEDKNQFLQITIPQIKSKKEFSFIFRILDSNFEYKIKYLQTIFTYFINPITDVEYLLGSVIDITKLRKKEEDLTHLISHLQSILDNTSKSISVINPEYKLIAFNQISAKTAEAFGITPAIGDSVLDYVPAEHIDKMVSYYKRVFAGERITLDEKLVYPAGHFLDELELYPIFNKDNTVDLMVMKCTFQYPHFTIALNDNKSKLSIAKSIIDFQETEKDRIATELHDGVNQLLCAAKVHFSELASSEAKINGIKLLDFALEEINQIINNSSKFLIQNSSFEHSVEEYLGLMFNHSNTKYKWTCAGDSEQNLNENLKLQIFRIVQEIIQNILKHAGASRINIKLRIVRSNIILGCSDNGIGFKLSEIKKGNGLDNILNRVYYLSGKIKIYSKLDFGTLTVIKIPTCNE